MFQNNKNCILAISYIPQNKTIHLVPLIQKL